MRFCVTDCISPGCVVKSGSGGVYNYIVRCSCPLFEGYGAILGWEIVLAIGVFFLIVCRKKRISASTVGLFLSVRRVARLLLRTR